MTMHRLILFIAFLTCELRGRRVRTSIRDVELLKNERTPNLLPERRRNPERIFGRLESLAVLLREGSLASAFNPFGPVAATGHAGRALSVARSWSCKKLLGRRTGTWSSQQARVRSRVNLRVPGLQMSDQLMQQKVDGELTGVAPNETDSVSHHSEYAYMYHQMDMLEDKIRTGAYHSAILSNSEAFKDKVVLDVGAGTCVLAIFAAMAGAKQVFAVEATDMARRGQAIVEGNNLTNVQVFHGTIETVELPSKVDIIISEWMGLALLRESMLDSVLYARDKWLKPGGALFPSHARLFVAPTTDVKVVTEKVQEFARIGEYWTTFCQNMTSRHNIDYSSVEQEFMEEQRRYLVQTGQFAQVVTKELMGPGQAILELDLLNVQLEELTNPSLLKVNLPIKHTGQIEGFCLYFDVHFRGSPQLAVNEEIELTTAPGAGGTHWGQQVFCFTPSFPAKNGDTLECSMLIKRQERNQRILQLETNWSHTRPREEIASLWAKPLERIHSDDASTATNRDKLGHERQNQVLESRAETYYVD